MYRVNITNSAGYSFNVKSGAHEHVVDMKGDSGMTPPDVLLASLGTCVGVYLRKYADGAKLNLTAFSIDVDAEFAKDPPVCFKKINVSIDLKETKLDERRIAALLEFIKNCPVHNTLKNNPDIVIQIV